MRTKHRDRLESFVLDENKTAILFYLAGAGAGIALLTIGKLSHRNHNIIAALVALLLFGTIVRFLFRDGLSPLAAQLMFTGGWIIVTVAASIGPSVHVNLAVLYMWVAVYAALYFTPTLIILQTGAAQAAYLLVLINSDVQTREVVVSWLSIFGTATVLSGVTYVLVSTLRKNSREDRLTGLPNRLSWDEHFDLEFERARRVGSPISVVSMDLDDFKSINDEQGHVGGDRLLREVADRWRDAVREGGDLIARLGGDEFGLLAPGSGDEAIGKVLGRLTETLPDDVKCSLGAATWDRSESSAELFRRADEKMFKVKRDRKRS
jgi:diguanylate cyclase (GGDEF)-like protein